MFFYLFSKTGPIAVTFWEGVLGWCSVSGVMCSGENVLAQEWAKCIWLRLPNNSESTNNSPVFLCCIFFCLANKHPISITVILSKCAVFVLIQLWLPVQAVVLSWCNVYYFQLNHSLATKPVFPDEKKEKT